MTENKQDDTLKNLVRELILELGEDPDREGLNETPSRVAKSLKEMLSGYSRSLKDEITIFENSYGYDGLIYSGGINFFSMCEHHLLPFFGVAHIAYMPKSKIVGLSKIARAVDIYSRRLQVQERLTTQIANELDTLLEAEGIIVMLDGRHLCNMARGVEKVNSNMKTIFAKGCLKTDHQLYNRFFRILNSKSGEL